MTPPLDTGPSTLTPHQALERKVDYLAEMVGEVHELVERRTPSEEALRAAVRDGIVAAASDPEVWATMIQTIQGQAQQHAGGWLLGRIKAFMSTLLWIFVLGMIIYMVGGWSALASFLKHGGAAP